MEVLRDDAVEIGDWMAESVWRCREYTVGDRGECGVSVKGEDEKVS
jgi:hypothetical protein